MDQRVSQNDTGGERVKETKQAGTWRRSWGGVNLVLSARIKERRPGQSWGSGKAESRQPWRCPDAVAPWAQPRQGVALQ